MVLAISAIGAIGAAANLAGGLTGALGGKPLTPQKLTIVPQPPSKLGPIEVQFNPTTYSITKPVSWGPLQLPSNASAAEQKAHTATQRTLNAPEMAFGGGGARTLTLELFFDVTEPTVRKGKTVTDVRDITNEFVKLTRIQRDAQPPQPPVCQILWGKPLDNEKFPFIGVVTNLVQNFLLFKSDGTPVRARLTIAFSEWIDKEKDLKQTDPEQTTRIVKRGDSLGSIAAEVYGDPALWRVIAEANDLDNPRRLETGRSLIVPKLR